MMIATFGRLRERFEWAYESEAEIDEPLGTMAVTVLRRLEPPQSITDTQIGLLQKRLKNWVKPLHDEAVGWCETPETVQGLRALNAQLWAWAERGGKLDWDDAYGLGEGPTDLLSGKAITRALELPAVYSPPLEDGSRRHRLQTPFAGLLVSTLEALFTGRIGICRFCQRLFQRSPEYAAGKRCPLCNRSKANASIEKACRAAITRAKRLPGIGKEEYEQVKRRCYTVLIEARQRKITASKAKDKLRAIVPERPRGRPKHTR